MRNPKGLQAHEMVLDRAIESLEREEGYWKWASVSVREGAAADGTTLEDIKNALDAHNADVAVAFKKSMDVQRVHMRAVLRAWERAKSCLDVVRHGLRGESKFLRPR